jgi:hypothetical protein
MAFRTVYNSALEFPGVDQPAAADGEEFRTCVGASVRPEVCVALSTSWSNNATRLLIKQAFSANAKIERIQKNPRYCRE